MFASSGFGQARTAPEQGPPPKSLTQLPDGHFSANQEPSNPEKFEVRVVKAGDSLSLIAGEVLNNQMLWPQLWEQNEHIINPHWIYPNDKILIRPVTQITEAAPPPPEPPLQPIPEPPPAAAAPAPAPAPEPPVVIAETAPPAPAPAPAPPREGAFSLVDARYISEVKEDDLYCSGFVRRSPVAQDLKVIGKYQESLSVFAVDSEYVYLSLGSEDGIAAGNIYQVVRPTTMVTNPAGRTKDEQTLGMHYLEISRITVVLTQPDYSLGRVMRNCGDPVEVGDIMVPFQQINFPRLPTRRPFSPLMTARGDVKGTIIIAKSALLNFGSVMKISGSIPGVKGGHLEATSRGIGHEGSIVYLDIGEGQAARPGDLFIIYRTIQLDSRLYPLPAESRKLARAREAIGELVILKVGERASTALVTYASGEVSLGDAVERR